MATPSSRVVPSASMTWKSHDLPTMQATGAPAATSAARVGSTSTLPAGLRVEPKATSSAVSNRSSVRARRKNSSSFGLACG